MSGVTNASSAGMTPASRYAGRVRRPSSPTRTATPATTIRPRMRAATDPMRILFTGASSFTGSWFARELCAGGHHVAATFRGLAADDYAGGRGARVKGLLGHIEPIWGVEFGDDRFIDAAGTDDFDLLLHHA